MHRRTNAPRRSEVRTIRGWLGALVALAVLTACATPTAGADGEAATALNRLTGGRANDEAHVLLQDLLDMDLVSVDSAVKAVAALVATFGTSGPALRETALVLAALEDEGAEPHASASEVLTKLGRGHDLDQAGLRDLVEAVLEESVERSLPTAVVVAGVAEHSWESHLACEFVNAAPCPIDEVVRLAATRQASEYEQWGHVDCLAHTNDTHPACVTFADCADTYARVYAAQGALGSQEWTAARDEAVESALDAQDACIRERYGPTVEEAYKALVVDR